LAGRLADERILRILASAGTGVTRYDVSETGINKPTRRVAQAIEPLLRAAAGDKVEISVSFADPLRSPTIRFAHQGKGFEPVYLDFDNESTGTQRLLALLVSAFRALDTGSVLVVDELDASLHTQACELILALFHPATLSIFAPRAASFCSTASSLQSKW